MKEYFIDILYSLPDGKMKDHYLGSISRYIKQERKYKLKEFLNEH